MYYTAVIFNENIKKIISIFNIILFKYNQELTIDEYYQGLFAPKKKHKSLLAKEKNKLMLSLIISISANLVFVSMVYYFKLNV